MKNVTSPNERYSFSPNMRRVYDDLKARVKPHNSREGTNTGPAKLNGTTPFIDAFEKYDVYETALAHGIVNSWMYQEPVVRPGEMIVGIPRPWLPIKEHFSYGLQVNRGAFEEDEAFEGKRDETLARFDAVKDRLDPGDMGRMYRRQEDIFGLPMGHLAYTGLWWTGGYQGHTVPYYEKLLRLGLDGIRAEIAESEKEHPDSLVLDCLKIICDGLTDFALKYADAVHAELEAAEDKDDIARWTKVEAALRRIAHDAPETLWEACQLHWIYCLWDWVDCIGRFDQYIYPFYVKAKAENETEADDLIASMMMRFYEHGIHNVTIGGCDPKTGKNSANEVTYLMLHILSIFHDSHPRVTVRIAEDTPHSLLQLMVRLWSEGMCDPTIASDTIIIDSFANDYGVALEDARDYSLLGCQELEIPGRSNFGCEDGMINLAKLLELTLNDGVNRFDDQHKRIGPATGHIYDYKRYEDLEKAYFDTIAFFVRPWVELSNIGASVRAINFSKMVKSIATDDCVKKAQSMDDGGARYNFGCLETAGLGPAADSLVALKMLVFDEKKVDPYELEKAMAANWEGYEDMRRMFDECPKFGNDNAEADEMARRVLEKLWSEVGLYDTFRGSDPFLGACSLLQGGIAYGRATWALPDGRFTGDPLGNTIGPAPGRELEGLTAMLNSVAKLNLRRGLGGTTCNVRIPKDTIASEEDREKIIALVETYLSTGGMQAQITTANLEELKDAQLHPEKHNDLLVRVGGFSVYFNQLDKASQDEIIKRYTA